MTRAYNEAGGIRQQTRKKKKCISEVIAPNAGDQRFRLGAPFSDRDNKNPSSDLLALLKAQKYALTRNLKTQVPSLNARGGEW